MLQNRLAQLREERAESDRGFTLIELLVVVVIIGILIAIAIPLYLNYTKGASDKSAASDLRGAIATLEQCNSDNGSYPASLTAVGTPATSYTACTGQSVKVSNKTTLTYFGNAATSPSAYIIEAANSNGTGNLYCYSSTVGGSVAKVTSTTTALAAYPSTAPYACPA